MSARASRYSNRSYKAHAEFISSAKKSTKKVLAHVVCIWNDTWMFAVAVSAPSAQAIVEQQEIQMPELQQAIPVVQSSIPDVPFYSQFSDIASASWQKKGCGVTSLAMVIAYYKPDTVSVDTLLKEGIAQGAYLQSAGWTYAGLIGLAQQYGLSGASFDLSKLGSEAALTQFKSYLQDGPVIASVHYKFNPKSTIPHLVVIDAIDNDTVYYNDPAAKTGEKQISTAAFLAAWKKRFIVVRPVKENKDVALIHT